MTGANRSSHSLKKAIEQRATEQRATEQRAKERRAKERKSERAKEQRAKSERANSLPCALFSLYCMIRTERNADPTVAVELPVVGGHLQQGLLHVAEKCEASFPIIMLQLFFN